MTHFKDKEWKERIESLSIESVIENDRAFKSMLGIGEDTYASTRYGKIISNSMDTILATWAGGALASSSVVAGTFFPAGGVLGLLGLGTAVTPIGWVIVGAAAAGIGYRGLKKLTHKLSGPVDVIPHFINSPQDVLAISLFDVMAPLTLKTMYADGVCDPEERDSIREYFVEECGYNEDYVHSVLRYMEEHINSFNTEECVDAFADFCSKNRDCNLPAITLHLEEFLQELILADGRVRVEEESELRQIRKLFQRHESTFGMIWEQATTETKSSFKEASEQVANLTEQVSDSFLTASDIAIQKGNEFFRLGAKELATKFSNASEYLSNLAENSKEDKVINKSRKFDN